MNRNLVILDPKAPLGTASRQYSWQPLDALEGKVVGFIDNSKPNFNYLVDELGALLEGKYGVASVVKHRKLSASIPALDSVLEDVKERCDLVITGSGD